MIPPSSPTKCIFPFKYLGKSYTECTFDDDTEAWCATGLDLFGNMVGEKARCGDDCNVQQPPTPRFVNSYRCWFMLVNNNIITFF